GEGWCFAIDAVSYIAVIGSLLAMTVTVAEKRTVKGNVLDELMAGFRYVAGVAPVRTSLQLLALVSVLGMPVTVLMPIIATKVLHGGPHTLGFLMTGSGLGAVAGALYLASRRSVLGLGRVMVVATTTFGAALVLFAFARSMWMALAVLPFVGGGMMVEMAST